MSIGKSVGGVLSMSIGVSGGGSMTAGVGGRGTISIQSVGGWSGWRKQSDVEEGRINLDGRRIRSLLGLGLEKYSAPVGGE
jgi:hypothetical protein